jgi:hypothetical protein
MVSCSPKNDTATYFGGKIINPKSKYVTLHSMGKIIDTLFLNDDNKFIGKLENVNEGLYYFIHGSENQYIYLEPQDSLMIRLNTWDFDESLVFAGKGAERNNILIDCFLEEENSAKTFYKFNTLEPKQFKHKADSLINLKLATYNTYVENHIEETVGFKNLLKVALTFPIYSKIEKYPILYAKYSNTKDFPKTDDLFYSYRKGININKDSLMYYYPYSNYIKIFLYNTTYSSGHKPITNKYSSNFTEDLLTTINVKINATESKNAFLKQTLIDHFYKKSSCNIDERAFEKFFELSTNKEDVKQIKLLLNDSKYLDIGKVIEDFNVTDFTNGTHNIKDFIKNKNTFLLFWSSEHFSKNYISSRINLLSEKFPEIKFLTIKFDCNTSDRIHNLDIKNQFFIDANSSANNLLTSKMPRSILIDKQGKVVNGFASISSNNIFHQLKELSKK